MFLRCGSSHSNKHFHESPCESREARHALIRSLRVLPTLAHLRRQVSIGGLVGHDACRLLTRGAHRLCRVVSESRRWLAGKAIDYASHVGRY
jgi:hypothetical protein